MDGQTLPACAKRLALELPLPNTAGLSARNTIFVQVGGKIFMLVTGARGRPLINLKSDPQNHC